MGLSKAGGSDPVPTNPPTASSVVFSNCQRIVIGLYTQNTSLVHKTLLMDPQGAATLPPTSYLTTSPSLTKSGHLSLTSNLSELMKGAMVKWMWQA